MSPSVLANRLAGKSISEMAYFVLTGIQNSTCQSVVMKLWYLFFCYSKLYWCWGFASSQL